MYSTDPRWTIAKFQSLCSQCQSKIAKGTKIFYFVIGKKVLCKQCGEVAAARFASEVADEENNLSM